MVSADSFGARGTLSVGDTSYEIYRLSAVDGADRLPFSLKVLLENLLRTEDGANVTADADPRAGRLGPGGRAGPEIQFTPARVVMQDFTGVPCVVDLATMREAMRDLGGDPARINPLAPAELVIDHSVIADLFGTPGRVRAQRRAGVRAQPGALPVPALGPDGVRRVQGRPARHRHRPPGQHRVPGPRGVRPRDGAAYPDTLVGTDSHTTMVNGLGVLGWGVGGIEAEAAMLGQPVSHADPAGGRLQARPASCPRAPPRPTWCSRSPRCCASTAWSASSSSSTAPGVGAVPLANRATIGNMSPEYGSTCAIFPIDDGDAALPAASPAARTSRSRSSRRTPRSRGCGTTPTPSRPTPRPSSWTCPPSSRRSPGPKRPQDRVPLAEAKQAFRAALADYADADGGPGPRSTRRRRVVPGQRPGRGRPTTAPACPAAARRAGAHGRAVRRRRR